MFLTHSVHSPFSFFFSLSVPVSLKNHLFSTFTVSVPVGQSKSNVNPNAQLPANPSNPADPCGPHKPMVIDKEGTYQFPPQGQTHYNNSLNCEWRIDIKIRVSEFFKIIFQFICTKHFHKIKKK